MSDSEKQFDDKTITVVPSSLVGTSGEGGEETPKPLVK
jgi:hypothetical protein